MTDPTRPDPGRRRRRRLRRRRCARALVKHTDRVDVTLIDSNDYHQFQPLLYQVATSMLGAGRHRVPAAQDRR